jgi:serine/threonine protein kinase
LLHKRANTIALSWRQKISLAVEIAKGMLALHEMKPPIIHRDLKSLNVFVIEKNGVFIAKVADFGLSRSPEAEMMTMYLGTLVIFILFSTGWPLSFWTISSIQSKLIFTPSQWCCGKYVPGRLPTVTCHHRWLSLSTLLLNTSVQI